jgi:hypothetical protein
LFVVPPGTMMRAMLIGHIAAHLTVVFNGCPDTDVHGRQHRLFRNHWRTSRYVVSNISGVMLRLKLCCVGGDHKLSYWSGGILLAT